jgi:hypothetical protein
MTHRGRPREKDGEWFQSGDHRGLSCLVTKRVAHRQMPKKEEAQRRRRPEKCMGKIEKKKKLLRVNPSFIASFPI